MIIKLNKVYSIFRENVILSDSSFINAIEGYDIENTIEVASIDDVIKSFHGFYSNIHAMSEGKVILYINPVSGTELYIGSKFIAYKENPHGLIRIKVVCDGASTIVTDNLRFLIKVSPLLKVNSFHKIIVSDPIGCLSYPYSPTISNPLNLKEIKFKLPVIL